MNIQAASQFHWSQLIQNSNITGCARIIWAKNTMTHHVSDSESSQQSEAFAQLDPEQKTTSLKFKDPIRRYQWILARACENRLKKELLSEEPCSTSIYHSVSHSKDALLIAGLSLETNSYCLSQVPGTLLGVGVDLEKVDRNISPAVHHRVTSVRERALMTSLSALEFWVIKEACFKANPLNHGTTIPQYQVLSCDSVFCDSVIYGSVIYEGKVGYFAPGSESPKKDLTFQYRIFSQDQWVVAFAVALCCCHDSR